MADGAVTRPDVDPAEFRQLLGRFATGVTVVTALDAAGRPHGMTANSLSSVSLHPPLLLLAIEKIAVMHPVILAAPHFVVNILADSQETQARRFARKEDDRFDGIGYAPSAAGVPVLDGVLAHIECERVALHEAGDHTIVVGRVTGGAVREGRPLAYFRGGYTGLA
jgi:flavin reductase (DIM6/NTAB) family NADH-FMN oxidoreductase RutF